MIRTGMVFSAGMLLVSCFGIQAQQTTKAASIVLEVKDQSGAVVPNAHILIHPSPSNSGENRVTANDGRLSVELFPGEYDLTVDSPGFIKFNKHIEAKSGADTTIDIVLKVGSCPPGSCTVISDVLPVALPAESQAVSPDGRYAIVGVDRPEEPYHTVFLEDRSLKSRRKLFNYDRRIVVLWKSDSKFFAVTDYAGSDNSRCTIFSVNEKAPPISVLDVLARQLSKDTWQQLESRLSNHHKYIEAFVWDGPRSLQVKISGYGDLDPAGFMQFYEVLLPVREP
jgi:hypothetical protein